MKITVFLIAFIGFSASAHTYAQNISLSEKNIPLEKAIYKIKQQSGFIFWYESKLLKHAPAISINIQNGTIRQALGYWQQGDTFHYVTPESSINHLSLAMVDRDRSVELNAERKLEFELKTPR